MTITFHCVNPSCRKKYRADDGLAGRLARCTKCHLTLRIPSPGEPARTPQPLDLDDDPDESAPTQSPPRESPRAARQRVESRDDESPTPRSRRLPIILAWLGGSAVLVGALVAAVWWIRQPSAEQEAAYLTYLRTSEELVEMHRAIKSEAEAAAAEPKLRAKAQENLDAWKQIQVISERKRELLVAKYKDQFSDPHNHLFDLVKDYASGKFPLLVVWGRADQHGNLAFFDSRPLTSGQFGAYEVLGLGKAGTSSTSGQSTGGGSGGAPTPADPPADPAARIRAMAGHWEGADLSLTIEPDGKGKYTLALFGVPTAGQVSVCFGSFALEVKNTEVVLRIEPTVAGAERIELEFVCRLSADRSSLELRETANRMKPNPITMRKGKPDPALVGEWRLESAYGVYTGSEKDELVVSSKYTMTIRGGTAEITGEVGGKPTTVKYTLELDPDAKPKRFRLTNPANADDFQSGIYRVESNTLLMRAHEFGRANPEFTISGVSINAVDRSGRDSDIPEGFVRKRGDKGGSVLRFGNAKSAEKTEGKKEKPAPAAELKKQIIGKWVAVANMNHSVEFLANGVGVVVASGGTIKGTFYDFVSDDTVQFADTSERVKLKLDGDQLELTDSSGKTVKYKRSKTPE
jgi:uncharacterized protein (TIGR03067 family)